jgi:hypothetical protein
MKMNRRQLVVATLIAVSVFGSAGCRGRLPFPRIPAVPKFSPAPLKLPRVEIPPGRPPVLPREVPVPKPLEALPEGFPRPFEVPPGVRPEPLPRIVGQPPVRPPSIVSGVAAERPALTKLADQCTEIHGLGERGEWAKLNGPIDEALRVPGLPAELRQPLENLRVQATQLNQLTQWQKSLALGEAPRLPAPGGAVVPVPLERGARGLNSLEALRAEFGQAWTKPPEVVAFEQHLTSLLAAEIDPVLVTRLQRCLAYKAMLAGHEAAAQRLMPVSDLAGDLSTQLRDLKLTVLGESSGVLGAGQKPTGAAGAIPIPEAGTGTVPPIREPAATGLPPLEEELASTTQRMRARLAAETREQIDVLRPEVASHLDFLHRVGDKARGKSQGKDKDDNSEAAVAQLLGRALKPHERIPGSEDAGEGEKSN